LDVFPLTFDLSPQHYYAGVLAFDFDLRLWGWLFLLPVDVLISSAGTQIIFYMIIPAIAVSSGLLVDWGLGSKAGRLTSFYVSTGNASPNTLWGEIGGYMPIVVGMMMGIAVIPLITHRQSIINSMKNAISGETGKNLFSARILWIGWGLTGLALIALIAAANVPIWYSPLLLGVISMWYLGMARSNAGSGAWMVPRDTWAQTGYAGTQAVFLSMVAVGLTPYNESAGAFNSTIIGTALLGPHNANQMITNPMMWNLEMFKLGQLNNADRKQLTVSMLVSSIIPVIIIVPLTLILFYNFGWQDRNVWNTSRMFHEAWNWQIVQGAPGQASNTDAFSIPMWGILITAFIATIALSFAKARFGGLLNYVSIFGIFFGMMAGDIIFWAASIVVTIIRFVVIRTGGTTMYNERVLPLGIGLIAGEALVWIIGITLDIFKGSGYI
jgi:hypothetical protein